MSIAEKVIQDNQVIEDFESDTTYSFPLRGRDQWVEKMKAVGYVEIPEFATADLTKGYWCNTCEYFIKKADSPTGYWCMKFEFSDQPWGCSSGWEYNRED